MDHYNRDVPPVVATLPFTAPWLLAPMDGVTAPLFRSLVLARNAPDHLGGAFTEFVRVLKQEVGARVLQRHLGEVSFEAPVGVQLMGSDAGALAASAVRAAEVGAPLVDLNFGCPARGALKGCAGSDVLREPARLEALVRACVEALAGRVPLTAKIRAGYDDAEGVEDLARAAQAGGASLLTVHARTRSEGYQPQVDWSRIARAVAAVSIPVCGNGGVNTHTDLERMRRETGCALVMVGQAAVGDPWIFSGRRVTRRVAADFLLEYDERMRAEGTPARKSAARVKQLLRYWTAGGLVTSEDHRRELLRVKLAEELIQRIREAGDSECSGEGRTRDYLCTRFAVSE
jgi:tRNA-dihydrouridine synthase C